MSDDQRCPTPDCTNPKDESTPTGQCVDCVAKAYDDAQADHLNPEDRRVLDFMVSHMDMSHRDVARHFSISVDRVRDILARDLAEVLR